MATLDDYDFSFQPSVNENQIRELWKTTDNIFVCLDGDSAGQKASERLSRLADVSSCR